MAAVKDNFADIDFEEITEATALEVDEIKVLKLCFNLFDVKKQDFLGADDLDDILRAMGFRPSKEELKEILEEIDEDGSGEIEFGEFCQVCANTFKKIQYHLHKANAIICLLNRLRKSKFSWHKFGEIEGNWIYKNNF